MAEPATSHSVLLVGGHDTGKTHYGGQLLGRLQLDKGTLRLRGTPESLVPFQNVLDCLAQGRAADHTPADTYEEVILPLATPAGPVDVVWPDYGGEQVRQVLEQRRVSEEWAARIAHSNAWILFVRPTALQTRDDIFTRPLHEISEGAGPPPSGDWSSQAWFVELLQIFLHIRRTGVLETARQPFLVIILSCWDEVDPDHQKLGPPALLTKLMPLFADFVKALWVEGSWTVFGLSSLSKPLSDKEGNEDEQYIERGPESFGYVVHPDGTDSPDLTAPLEWLFSQSP